MDGSSISKEVKFITLFSELSKIGPISVLPTLRGKSVVFGFGDLNGAPWIDEESVQCDAHILHVTNRGFFAAAQGGVVRDAYNPVRGTPTTTHLRSKMPWKGVYPRVSTSYTSGARTQSLVPWLPWLAAV